MTPTNPSPARHDGSSRRPSRRRHSHLLAHWLGLVWLLNSNASFGQELTEESISARFNWQPLSIIPKDERDDQCWRCGGKYVDPLAGVDTSQSPAESDLEVSAGDSDISDDSAEFYDTVIVEQGYRRLEAERVSIDRVNETVSATGPVKVQEPGILMLGDTIEYDSLSEQATLTEAEFVLFDKQLYGRADEVTRDRNGSLDIDDGALTFCTPDDPSWLLSADTIRVNTTNNTGEAWGAKIGIKGVPIAYLPWVQFPLGDQRKTGLLFPDIGSDTRGGFDITAPIYLNLAPDYDATYSPRHIGDRGLMHQLNARRLGKRWGLWSFNGSLLSDDRTRNDSDTSDRWLVNVNQESPASSRLRTSINYTRVSDNEYLRDLENNTLSAQRQTALLQRASADWLDNNWLLSLEAQQFQSIAEDLTNTYKKLPQITARWRGQKRFGELEPMAVFQVANFDTDLDRVKGQRIYSEVGVSSPVRRSYGFITPSLRHRALRYDLKQPGDPSANRSINLDSWVASVDAGLEFDRTTSFFGKEWLQTLEPRAHYLYASYEDHEGVPDFDSAELTFSYRQLFRTARFSGFDRLADANQFALGVTSRLIDPESGVEKVTASIGQVFHFRDQKVRLNDQDPALTDEGSALAFSLDVRANERWSVQSNFLFDAYDRQFDAANVRATYRPAEDALINVGYTLREPPPSSAARPVTEQVNASTYIPINRNWRGFAAVRYSMEINSTVEDMVGVEYDGCCWRARLIYMSYLDPLRNVSDSFTSTDLQRDRAFQFQFVLKGLGGFGSRVDNLMQDMIRGFNGKR